MMIKVNDKIKNILKVAMLWILLVLFFSLLPILIGWDYHNWSHIEETLGTIFHCIIMFLLTILCFIPTIIFLWFLSKKLKTTFKKILLISFAIPFTNMIYFLVESSINATFSWDSGFNSMMLGATSLFLLYCLFWCTLMTPKKWLALKVEILLTSLCMFCFGWVLIFVSIYLLGVMEEYKVKQALNGYSPVIEYIRTYQEKNKKYPVNIEEVKLSKNDIFPDFEYKAYDNNEGFVLTVFKESPKYYNCRYCSSEKYEGCKVEKQAFYKSKKVGDWIEMYYKD